MGFISMILAKKHHLVYEYYRRLYKTLKNECEETLNDTVAENDGFVALNYD